jgi:hypothetical protein
MMTTALFLIAMARAAAPGPFGVGVVLGSTTGASFGWRPTEQNGMQAAVGWDMGAGRFDGSVDYLQTVRVFAPGAPLRVPVYVGLGAELATEAPGLFGDAAGVWARVPIGASLFLEEVPLEVFAQVVPRVRVLPVMTFGADAAIGGRWYF